MTTRSRVRMPFLKMRLSRFVVGLSLCPVGALLSTMLPVRGYHGSFLRGIPPLEALGAPIRRNAAGM